MSPEAINLKTLREAAEKANNVKTTYADLQAMWEELAPWTVLALIDVAEAATDESAVQGFCILCEHDWDAFTHAAGCSLARFTTGENE